MVSPELEARRQQAGSLRAEIRPAKVAGELSQLTNCRRRSTSPSSSPGYSLSTQTSARRTASPLPPSQRTARTCSPRTCPHTTPSRRAAAPRRCAAPLPLPTPHLSRGAGARGGAARAAQAAQRAPAQRRARLAARLRPAPLRRARQPVDRQDHPQGAVCGRRAGGRLPVRTHSLGCG